MVAKIKSFSDLDAWKEAVELAVLIYRKTKYFPKEEVFGLISQLRRAGVSVSSNIAEGFSRGSNKDKIRFYFDARGSVTEIQSQLVIAREVNYITKDVFYLLADKTIVVHKLINGLIRKMKENENTKY
jgi:four helix bundle protein